MAHLKKMIDALFCVLFLLVPLTYAESVFPSNCGTTRSIIDINGVDVSPFPVSIGQKTTIKIDASTDEAISGGTVWLHITQANILIFSDEQNLCDTTTCSNTIGAFIISLNQTLPEIIPGQHEFRVDVDDVGGRTLACITFFVKVQIAVHIPIAETLG